MMKMQINKTTQAVVFLLPKIRQDVASSSFLGSSPESGGANPPPATILKLNI